MRHMIEYNVIITDTFISVLQGEYFNIKHACLLNNLQFSGVKRLSSNLEEMTGIRPNIFFRVCWLVIAPVLITVSQHHSEDASRLRQEAKINFFPPECRLS